MRPVFEPRLVNDAFGDPGLYVDFRDEQSAPTFDIGDVCGLPPREPQRTSDNLAGDTLVRRGAAPGRPRQPQADS
jgi:hypothetical protein